MIKETVADLTNKAISQRDQADKHSLELADDARATNNAGAPEAQVDASREYLPAEQRAPAKSYFDVYLDDFISVFQGGTRDMCEMLRHLFHQIDPVFLPNKEADTNHKDPISRKNLGQGDGDGSTRNTVLGWDLDTISHLLCLPPR